MRYRVSLRNYIDIDYFVEAENEEEAALMINDADASTLASLEQKEVYCYYGTTDVNPA